MIQYEPHPVSPERKRELREQGYRIVDARFAPVGAAPSVPQSPGEIDKMPKKEVKDYLEAHGDDNPTGTVAELRDRLKSVMFVGI